jgi:hypothetical protein
LSNFAYSNLLSKNKVFNAEAQNCWNPTGGTAYAGVNVASLTVGEKCIVN